jgi:hypothetical protein
MKEKKPQTMTEQQFIETNRRLVLKDVNRGVKDPIDRKVFHQTQEQKEAAWAAKSPDPVIRKKYNNPICL